MKYNKVDYTINKNVIKQRDDLLNGYYYSILNLSSQMLQLRQDREVEHAALERVRTSLSWRITFPLRIIYSLLRGKLPTGHSFKYICQKSIQIYKADGYQGLHGKIKQAIRFFIIDRYKKKRIIYQQSSNIEKIQRIVGERLSVSFLQHMSPCILIVAEVTLPQCYKYRVQQKAEHFKALGWHCCIVDWRDHQKVLSYLQLCKDVIFYRVPGFDTVLQQIAEAKRLGLSPWWEVDDLIFDKSLYLECSFIQFLPRHEKDLLLFGSGLFRKAMLACDRGIASTESLSFFMKQAGVKEVCVVDNALDSETLSLASHYYPLSYKNKDSIVILYGSGTNTHNADFLVAAEGILSALQNMRNIELWIVGDLKLPKNFESCQRQIKYITSKPYDEYLGVLAQADIAIAPLESISFNDAKSNIKYIEASILGIPSVCSPRKSFTDIIDNHTNGLLANTVEEWQSQILLLARNKNLREQIGQQAYHDVLNRYMPERVMQNQVKPIWGEIKPNTNKLNILVVNVYYSPYSFGGATFIAEQTSKLLNEYKDVEISIFTLCPDTGAYEGIRRYQNNGSTIYSVNLPKMFSDFQQFDNVDTIQSFEQVLEVVKPDIVHFHSIQTLGLQMVFSCQRQHIPYVITLHDAWWLCDRQFMVNGEGYYCFQEKIDLNKCKSCKPKATYLSERYHMMHYALHGASLLFCPGETHRQLYIANGISADKIKVNRNGVIRPLKHRSLGSDKHHIRFGFVAGDEIIKGAALIKKTFQSLDRSDWSLIIIDSKVNMGHDPIDVKSWRVKGTVTTTLPYDYHTIDDFFSEIDVLLFPSQWKESYGMTVREALLRDVWVICTHPGGQSEDVIDGINGNYISLKEDVEEFKHTIESLLDNASMFHHYSNPYKDHIATFSEQADELLAYYRSIKGQ